MRLLARSVLFLVAILFFGWLFRSPLYRAVISYRVVGEREEVPVRVHAPDLPMDLHAAINALLDTTASRLHFSTGRVSNDPGKLVAGSAANCIGYAALFNALLNAHLDKSGMRGRYVTGPVIGKLYLGGMDLHALADDPFWKDHDIVRITDRRTGEVILVDPTLYDAVGIGRVRGQ